MIVNGEMLCDSRQFTDRQAMLLPDNFTSSFAELNLLPVWLEKLKKLSTKQLVETLDIPTKPLVERFAAGKLLALFGDPRIQTLDPQMVDIPAADVELGLPFEDVPLITKRYSAIGVQDFWIKKECPIYKRVIKAFRISKFPVTNQEYRDFLVETGYPHLPSSWNFGIFPIEKSNHPVHTVDHIGAQSYVKWLSQKTQRKFRLPTESEWEFAAAGRERLEFPWGNEFDENKCNTLESKIFETTPVGIFTDGLSWCGAYDMAGNVEEIVDSKYEPYPGGKWQFDHLNEQRADYFVTRGGCFSRFEDLARCKRRHGGFPSKIFAVGFRIAESKDD